jgi:hypothetical protein
MGDNRMSQPISNPTARAESTKCVEYWQGRAGEADAEVSRLKNDIMTTPKLGRNERAASNI